MNVASSAIEEHENHDHHAAHEDPGFFRKYIFSIDHKIIGLQFLFMGLMFMVVGGLLAMLIRWQMAWPDDQTQWKDHPVPILAKSLWSKMSSDLELDIRSVDVKSNTVIAKRPSWLKLKAGDGVTVKAGESDIPGKVAETSGTAVTIKATPTASDPAAIQKLASARKIVAPLVLGKINSVDTANKTVTITGISPNDIHPDDAVNIKGASGDVSGKVLSVMDHEATISVSGAELPKAGDKVIGKRVPGSMPPDFYNMVLSMHATIMIFFVLIPILVGAFGNYLIPLNIGAADMAFPFLNGFVFWSALAAGAIMVAGFFMPGGGPAAGWTSYPPLSAIHQDAPPWGEGKPGEAPKTWREYERPKSAVERIGEFFRIKGNVATLDNAQFDAGLLTARFAAHTAPSLIEKSSELAKAALAEYRKAHPQANLAGIVIDSQSAAVGTLTIKGADAATASELLAATRDKLRWQGTWSDAALLAGFVIMSMMFGFICAYQVKLGGIFSFPVGLILSMAGGWLMLKGVQYAAFDGQSAWFMSIILLGFSSILGAVNYLTTIVKLRCPGMTMFRMPLSVWSLFITSLLVLLATPVLASVLTLNLLDHHRWTSFFLPLNWTRSGAFQDVAGGGNPLLHEHLFWFYSHPAVYIMILPAMGMVSDIIAVFARKPVFGYRPMIYALAGIAFLGFIVWAHHMFQSGMNPTLGTTFAISTMFIAVPSAIKVFNWLGTLWRGNIHYTTPMLNALAFVSMFVIGGLSGIFMASTSIDVHIHATYFIVAHIHYVLFGGSIFGIMAAIYFWYPKMFGRMMNEPLGKIHFWLTFIAFNCTFLPMHILGLRGMPRRVAGYLNYPSFADLQPMNVFITISAFVMGAAQLFFVINFIGSWIWGKKAPANPWNANTLEWAAAPSPPPHGNFAVTPRVYHGPYEYSSPLSENDWLPQTQYVDQGHEAMAAAGH